MPIVPIYQGGVPQVGANATATTPIQAPRPAIDYERTFQQAMQPISAGVDAVGKIIATEHARNVKAESDEAEAKFMACVQNRLLSPETGYMGLQGKNAVDGFQPTQDALRKDMSDILGGLSPEVRSAVESRIQDRFLSARGQMLRWNQVQTQQWHLNSSKARMESLIDDAAQHYGDEDYLAKTWLSVAEEANYQARIQGFDEEGRKQAVQGLYDLFESQRFSQWAADDAVGAFAAAQRVKPHMSADVWGKLDSGLWGAAKQEIALRLSQMVPPLRSKQDVASVVLDRAKRTGWAVVDDLSPARKAEVYSTAWGYMERARTEGRSSLKREIDNSLARASVEGTDPNALSEDMFVEAYGEEEGKERFADYSAELSGREKVFQFSSLTNDSIDSQVESLRPTPGSKSYKAEADAYRFALRAAEEVKRERSKDPIRFAVKSGQWGVTPISAWTSQVAYEELGKRVASYREVNESFGVTRNQKVLSAEEAKSLAELLSAQKPEDAGQTIERIVSAVGQDTAIAIAGQLGDSWKNVVVLGATEDEAMANAVPLYLKGRAALAAKDASVSSITSATVGVPAIVPAQISGLYSERETEAVLDAITNIAAGLAVDRGGIATQKDIKSATQMIVGDVYQYHLRKIPLKDGADLTSVETTVRRLRQSVKDMKRTVVRTPGGVQYNGADFAKILETAPLVPSKSGEPNVFNVLAGSEILLGRDGRPYEVRIWQ